MRRNYGQYGLTSTFGDLFFRVLLRVDWKLVILYAGITIVTLAVATIWVIGVIALIQAMENIWATP